MCSACGTVCCGFVGVSVCCVWDSLGGFRGVVYAVGDSLRRVFGSECVLFVG